MSPLYRYCSKRRIDSIYILSSNSRPIRAHFAVFFRHDVIRMTTVRVQIFLLYLGTFRLQYIRLHV